MRIGILTLYYNNLNMGGLLQAYALQKKVKSFGVDVEQISYNYLAKYSIADTIHKPYDKMRNKNINKISKKIKNKVNNYVFRKRKSAFLNFMEDIPHSEYVYENVRECAEKYEKIIVGSDQVWGEWLPKAALDDFFLAYPEFLGKRYSYAAGTGSSSLPAKYHQECLENLKGFESISVRENSLKSNLDRDLSSKMIVNNLDPTLLLKREEWDQIVPKMKLPKTYIFCYFLGKDKTYRKAVLKFSKEHKLPIVTIPYIKDNKIEDYDKNFGNIRDFVSGPAEFIALIKNAEYIFTDSFHAVVFSSIYHKKFWVMDRIIVGDTSTNSRITDFTKKYNLEERYVKSDDVENYIWIDNNINYKIFDELLEKERKEAEMYLENIVK